MGRQTNIDVELLARSPLVRAFMQRITNEVTDALTGHIFAVSLAKRAADAFDLYHDDGKLFAAALLEVAEEVIDARRASKRASIRRTLSLQRGANATPRRR